MKAYQMKIVIKNSHPPIWRRFIVPAGLTFSQLGFVLNEVMGWFGGHLSQFEFYHLGIVVEENPEDMGWLDKEVLDSVDTPIEPFMDSEDWFTYIYDFGDYWEHRVEIEKILPEYEFDYPMVLKYKGNTPYEDCGGIYGYYHLLEVLDNPEDEEYEEMKEWVQSIPSGEYDLELVNQELQRYSLSKVTHAPMSRVEIYESIWNGEPLYTIGYGLEGVGREEASLEEWRALYEAAAKIKELKPWERFWDMDLFALGEGEDVVFAVILGRGGECYGISIYEGLEGLNDFMMLCNQAKLNLSETYVGFTQNNLTCYWGNRDELSQEQYQIIKSLGYKFRGKNQWPYFMSYRTGYLPYNMDAEEVGRMTVYLSRLAQAIAYYEENKFDVGFERGNMFYYAPDERTGQWSGAERGLPFVSYQFLQLDIADEKFMQEFCKIPQKNYEWDIHIECVPAGIDDAEYERPGVARMVMLADTASGMILGADIVKPDEFEGNVLINSVLQVISKSGRPRGIRVCNDIMENYLCDLCSIGKIKLKKVKKMPVFRELLEELEGGWGF